MDVTQNQLTWPPTYSIKKSARARHVKLQASLQRGLELIVPLRFNQHEIPAILEKNKSWIEKQLLAIQAALQHAGANVLPDEIVLPAIQQRFAIVYLKSDQTKIRLFKRQSNELVVFGDISNQSICKKLLVRFVKKQALMHLPPMLKSMSEKIQLPYQSISIRAQRSRWGSCSSKKAINLNYKLLFLPRHLVEHILIHELCHTVHLNHSVKFWQLVQRFDTEWKQHNKAIKQMEQRLPLWLE